MKSIKMKTAYTTIAIIILALSICFAGCSKSDQEIKVPVMNKVKEYPNYAPQDSLTINH